MFVDTIHQKSDRHPWSLTVNSAIRSTCAVKSSFILLHKFRHTFATRNLQDHVCEIKTLQNWMGHKDLALTMVYLKAVRNKDVMARVNSSGLAALAV